MSLGGRSASFRTHLLAIGRQSREALVLAAVTGAATGLVIAGFEWITARQLLERLYELPVAVQVVAPALGLIIAGLALHWLGRDASPSTSDEYIKNFHQPDQRLDLRPVPARAIASIATLGFGGALGFEGPSIYFGAAIGTALQNRFRRLFGAVDVKVLMVAGAAAGVAAIFKTPATGAIFALEVPFQNDTAKRMLLPALIASVTSYLVYVAINGTTPLFPVDGSPPFGIRELAGAALVGVLAGLGARGFAGLVGVAKHLVATMNPLVRIAGAGALLAALTVICRVAFGQSLTLGSGYNVIAWLAEGPHPLWALVAVLAFRTLAAPTTIAGGGAGGLFVPLVVCGALLGQVCGDAFGETSRTLFPVIGIAAFLGAGYRTPLAAVMFVAESTGRPGFIVPGVIAAVVSQLMMGTSSVSAYQLADRGGHLERRFKLPITTAIRSDGWTAPPDITLDELVHGHLIATQQTTVPVVDGSRYLGLVSLDDLATVPKAEWVTVLVGSIAHDDAPHAEPSWTVEDAVRAMEAADLDLLPVVDGEGRFGGTVRVSDLVRLDEILRRAEEQP